MRTELRDGAHRQIVRTHDHRGLAETAAEIGIADADLLGDICAAAAGLERHFDVVLA